METKICSKCRKELPVTEFHKKTSSKDGLQYICKSCVIASRNEQKEILKKSRLEDFTPRELILELKRRGYRGVVTYIEERKINIGELT